MTERFRFDGLTLTVENERSIATWSSAPTISIASTTTDGYAVEFAQGKRGQNKPR